MVACQAPLSVGFSGQEYWSGLPFPTARDLFDPGINLASLVSLALATWEARDIHTHASLTKSPPKTSPWHPIGCQFKTGPDSGCYRWLWPAEDLLQGLLLSSREPAWNLLAPYHLTHLIIRIAILTFIGWDTISWFLLYLLCSLLPRKPCPLSSSTFLSPKDWSLPISPSEPAQTWVSAGLSL